MSTSEFEDEDGEGYFASISDLMVGILFVFLLMLTVFALNFRDAEDDQKVAKHDYDLARVDAAAARNRARIDKQRADRMTMEAYDEKKAADQEHRRNADLSGLLGQAVARINQDIRDRDQARIDLLADLTKSLSDNDMTVILDPDSVVLRLPESLLFDSGQSTLGGGPDAPLSKRQAALDVVKKVSDVLATKLQCYVVPTSEQQCEARDRGTLESVLIEGHSDKAPFHGADRPLSEEESVDRNDRLSVDRALTVFKALQQNKQLKEISNANGFPLLAVSAYGDRRPIAQGKTEEIYKKNRRIDMRFLLSTSTSKELKTLVDAINSKLQESQ